MQQTLKLFPKIADSGYTERYRIYEYKLGSLVRTVFKLQAFILL